MNIRPQNLPFLVGVFLSAVFVIAGLSGTYFTGSILMKWWDSAHWPTATGEILSGELRYTNSTRGGRTVRPHFTWSYETGGRGYQGEGYGFTDVSTSDLGKSREILADHPPGKKVDVLVNPADPADSALVRDSPGLLVVPLIPPVFFCFGLIGAFFTATGWLGWYRKGTRNPIGKAGRALVHFVIRPRVIMVLLATGIAAAFAGMFFFTWRTGNAGGVIMAVVLGFTLYRAYRFSKPGRRGGGR